MVSFIAKFHFYLVQGIAFLMRGDIFKCPPWAGQEKTSVIMTILSLSCSIVHESPKLLWLDSVTLYSYMWKIETPSKKKKNQLFKNTNSWGRMSRLLGSSCHLGAEIKTKRQENERNIQWYHFPLIKFYFLLLVSWLCVPTVNNSQYRKIWTLGLGGMTLTLELK